MDIQKMMADCRSEIRLRRVGDGSEGDPVPVEDLLEVLRQHQVMLMVINLMITDGVSRACLSCARKDERRDGTCRDCWFVPKENKERT